MRTEWRSSSPSKERPALAVALSARALAAAARRAGAPAIALDLFADDDTARHALALAKLPRAADTSGESGHGLALDRDALIEKVKHLGGSVCGLVYGAGFEHDPALLARLRSSVPILGNAPEVVAAAKDPLRFAALLERLGAPHPRVALEAPGETGWLRKRAGGAGGAHVTPAVGDAAGFYFQRRAEGRAASALFLADGREARVLGYSEQWAAPTAAAPFRYGGCAGPVALGASLERAIDELCHALAAALGLVGLNSLDLLVEDERFHVLEVNPRPGATLDLFDGRDGRCLWRLHLDAVAGRLAACGKSEGAARAAAVLYAPADLRIPDGFAWPEWTADRTPSGSFIAAGAPVCTVMATAPTPAGARRAADARARCLVERLAPVRQAMA